ncbi:hypothetical protein PIB30_025489 [Stylosanthes scabra]|uniref:Xylanase inhibitor C-terminal domain-containing protein n=1 Tax=Stylosanthes scabra TaxID=79078 RepID=A0ABU6X7K4_9FABA|nr:hypothetical protein [Stylosanthes scabra]
MALLSSDRGGHITHFQNPKKLISQNFLFTHRSFRIQTVQVILKLRMQNTPSNQYFIGLTSIKVNGKQVPINGSLLTINKENGFGGTKISSDVPYGVLESSIYKAFTKLFVKEASSSRFNLTTISTLVKPYGVCYSAERVTVANGGPVVPTVDLVLHRDDVVWRVGGGNSMVRVTDKKKKLDVWCLGFVDGGVNNKTSIVIGGKQLEENLVQFDLENNRFGFSSSLASRSLSCADFKVVDFAK